MEESINQMLENPELTYAVATAGAVSGVYLGKKAVGKALDHMAEARYDTPSHTSKDLEDAEGIIDSYLASRQKENWREKGILSPQEYETDNDSNIFENLRL